MKTPLGTEVDLGPGHIVLDGVSALRERGTAAHPLFAAHAYCGHGRPSQLLLSSCLECGSTACCTNTFQNLTRSTRTVHTSVKARLISVAIRIHDTDPDPYPDV